MIITTKRGQEILIDDADAALLSCYLWHIDADGYACGRPAGTSEPIVKMHRLLLGLGPTDPSEGDHWNGNRCDNRRANLRVVDHGQNARNARRRKDNSSGHKGVHLEGRRWRAYVNVDRRRINLGSFRSLDLAVEFRELAAEMAHGEFVNHGRAATA